MFDTLVKRSGLRRDKRFPAQLKAHDVVDFTFRSERGDVIATEAFFVCQLRRSPSRFFLFRTKTGKFLCVRTYDVLADGKSDWWLGDPENTAGLGAFCGCDAIEMMRLIGAHPTIEV